MPNILQRHRQALQDQQTHGRRQRCPGAGHATQRIWQNIGRIEKQRENRENPIEKPMEKPMEHKNQRPADGICGRRLGSGW